jgi:phosphoribosyl-ATP pyrophosphohydrolase
MAPVEGTAAAPDVLDRIAATIVARRSADPTTSYVAALFARGEDAILKKIGEEATEAVMAAKDGDKLRIAAEVADLWFHCLVLLACHGLGPEDVRAELARREGTSGVAEKDARRR